MEAPPRPLAGLDYETCTLKELQLFFKQRSAKELPAYERHDKRFVIRCLRLLDDNFTFRFMDLAGELRNIIYERLLLYNRNRPAPLYPEILRVSRRCHAEGLGILKQECSPSLVFSGIPQEIQDTLSHISHHSTGGTPLTRWLEADAKIKEASDLVVRSKLRIPWLVVVQSGWRKTAPQAPESLMIDMLGRGAERCGCRDLQRMFQFYLRGFARMRS
ncbi:uncharacterized protein MYCFIDRAFT_81327 [Pseudocercospora fijiensis CIRAD86]|uniref:Uncharacterized protein n=1 Tax=Pseudocercospora fijiensis (strain CIRAD86) TaxID=383855 RepID=M3AVX1_PSEFD|nr:uncharacterized protein MYCFIDRAFT_81327 [Pseudocercospora fijiensis CIRAD86]EME81253.1 hypothetical protein MYCFIDRAFT_81327 [Pseudocercospora fijiensis CIRAD86]